MLVTVTPAAAAAARSMLSNPTATFAMTFELRSGGGEQFGIDAFGEGDDRGARTGDAGFEFGSIGRRFRADPDRCAERRAGVPWHGR